MKPCKTCGSSVDSSLLACNVCNQSFIKAIALQGPQGVLSASLRTVVGRPLLKSVIGEDCQYAADEQFVLERRGGGPWLLVPCAGVRNRTFIGDIPVPPEGGALTDGDVVSLAGKAGRMTVRIVWES